MLYIIYCIWVKTEDGVLRYYGHTENLRVRKNKHVAKHKAWVKAGKPEKTSEVYATRSVYILEYEDWRMDVVDEVEHEDEKKAKDKARAKEGEWILKNDCVNMIVSGRTQQEYRETHKEKRRESKKQYYEQHKEETKEYKKQYYETNKAEIEAKRAEKVTCDVCGSVVSKGNIAIHNKTKKHINALNALNPDINTIQ